MITIRACSATDFDDIHEVCNDAARAYRGVIADDQWKDPYMPEAELRCEIDAGVRFFGAFDDRALVAVMGIQRVDDVDLIRHAYTRTSRQGHGVGSALLEHLRSLTDRPMLIGTWRSADWAIRFYQGHGFRLIEDGQRAPLLRRYWSIPGRQIDESVVLADARWFAHTVGVTVDW